MFIKAPAVLVEPWRRQKNFSINREGVAYQARTLQTEAYHALHQGVKQSFEPRVLAAPVTVRRSWKRTVLSRYKHLLGYSVLSLSRVGAHQALIEHKHYEQLSVQRLRTNAKVVQVSYRSSRFNEVQTCTFNSTFKSPDDLRRNSHL